MKSLDKNIYQAPNLFLFNMNEKACLIVILLCTVVNALLWMEEEKEEME